MNKIIFASHNDGKITEITEMLKPFGIDVISAKALDAPDVEETGATFEENAALKADTLSKHYNLPCFGDDSGLEVNALDGMPGVYTKRWCADTPLDDKNCGRMLEALKDVPTEKRGAQFVCVIAFARPNCKTVFFKGTSIGTLTTEKRGEAGFGLDPLFIPEGETHTYAEMDSAEKEKTSHRKRALAQFISFLETL